MKFLSKVKSKSVVLRIINKGKVVWYRSVRLGTITILPDGFETDVPAKFVSCTYELKNVEDRKVIETGKIVKEKKTIKPLPDSKK